MQNISTTLIYLSLHSSQAQNGDGLFEGVWGVNITPRL